MFFSMNAVLVAFNHVLDLFSSAMGTLRHRGGVWLRPEIIRLPGTFTTCSAGTEATPRHSKAYISPSVTPLRPK